MLKGIDISQRIEFSSKEDTKPKTVFILRPLTGIEMLEITKHIEDGQLRLSGQYIIDLLKKAIVEVKNPDISDSQKIEDYINGLPSLVLMEIVTEVGNINNLTETERKN